MLEVDEKHLDRITEAFHRILRGEKPPELRLPAGHPEDELHQLYDYVNRFLAEYEEFAGFMYSMSRGDLNYEAPKGHMRVLQSFKSLQASLRHLTWKTQRIAAGDFSQKVDFMGDFSAAFNLMAAQLKQAFEDIERANRELSEKNRQITDSIRYARHIQNAVLPPAERMERLLREHFVIYLPRDIVSGDFYWTGQSGESVFVAVADCTGHGVPGAFLTMVGHTLLDQILAERIVEPNSILESLHMGVRRALQQDIGDSRDGMDICLCRFDSGRCRVKFAGAKRPLYRVSGSTCEEVKGDSKSIGGHQKESCREFSNCEVEVKAGDMLYLLTDGLPDQPDPENRKFGSKNLKAFLERIAELPMEEQRKAILEKLNEHSQNAPQRDDITMVGLRMEGETWQISSCSTSTG